MTAEHPWTSASVAKGYRGNPRVSTASATAHDTSTANATVVAIARAAVFPLANSVVPAMPTDECSRQWPRPRDNDPGGPRKSAAIATAVVAEVQPQQFSRLSVAVRGHFHGNHPIVIHNISHFQ